jgi:simple sugar transport system substrate-binding protein
MGAGRRMRGVGTVGLLAVAVGVSACGGGSKPATNTTTGTPPTAASGKHLTIAMVGYQQDAAFWQTIRRGAEAAGKEYGVTVNYSAPQSASDQGMIQLLNSAIAAKPDGLAINYTGKVMEPITKQALDAGIAVELYNNNRFEGGSGGETTDPAITTLPFVGQTATQSAEVLGTAFAKLLTKPGRVLIVNPFPQAFVLTLRAEGITTAMKAAGRQTDVLVAGADEARNQALISAYLQRHKDVAGIVGLGTPGANPGARAQAAAKLDIPVATFDIDESAYNNIKAGTLTVALNQQPYLQGYLSVLNMVLALRDGFKMVNMDTGSTFLVTKDNLEQVGQLIKEGRG